MAESNLEFLSKYFNNEIPEEDYIFRRVSLNTFLQSDPEHKLVVIKGFFRNEDGDGMSIDWERICNDPRITQTRDGRREEKYGVIVISCFDLKGLRDRVLKVINDQESYLCHCLVKGFPMSLRDLERSKIEIFNKLSDTVKKKIKSALIMIREYLIDNNAFWVIPFNTSDLREPPEDFNYSDLFTERIRKFFSSRGHQIPS